MYRLAGFPYRSDSLIRLMYKPKLNILLHLFQGKERRTASVNQ